MEECNSNCASNKEVKETGFGGCMPSKKTLEEPLDSFHHPLLVPIFKELRGEVP